MRTSNANTTTSTRLPHCTAVFEGEAHGQLRDRIGKAVELGPLDLKEGQALLAELDDAQPFPNVGLAHGQYAEIMLLATQFYPGRIASIVAGAVERGCWRGKGRLDEGDFWVHMPAVSRTDRLSAIAGVAFSGCDNRGKPS